MSTSTPKGRRFAVLVALSLVAGLMAVSSPASAATGDVESKPVYSACVDGATASAGFTDVPAGAFYEAAANCMKYYGVTAGKTATTYAPNEVLPRWQMAIFLAKVAELAGHTLSSGATGPFTDLAGVSAAGVTAINQIYALGLTAGKSATTFAPFDTVTRWEMAIFIETLLGKSMAGPGGATNAAISATLINGDGTSASGFTDLGAVTSRAANAIEEIYDLAVTAGKGSATTFKPFDKVNRGEMAVFLAAAMKHTNARPAGISFQADKTAVTAGSTVNVAITVRDSAFKPVPNALVDVFQAALADKAIALNANGTCATAVTSATFGATECTIDVGDPDTNAMGNITAAPIVGASVIWWAWTGANGATFDVDTTPVAAWEVTASAAPVEFKVTTSVPDSSTVLLGGNQVKYGTSVSHTFQLVDSTGKDVALAGQEVKLRLDTYVDGVGTTAVTVTQKTDANGTIVWDLGTAADPNTGAWVAAGLTDNETEVKVVLISQPAGFNPLDLALVPNGDPDVTFNDDPSATTSIVAAKDVYTTGTTAAPSATVYDQYGLARAGVTVAVTTDDSAVATAKAPLDSLGALVPDRVSNSSGVVGQPLTRLAGEDDGVDEVTFFIDANDNNLADDAIADTQLVFFAKANPPNTTFDGTVVTVDFDLALVDTANDSFVVYYDGDNTDLVDGEYWLFTWAAGDQFQIAGSPVTQTAFETAIADGATAGDVMIVKLVVGLDLWNIATDL